MMKSLSQLSFINKTKIAFRLDISHFGGLFFEKWAQKIPFPGDSFRERGLDPYYPNSFFVLCIYTDSTSPTQIYSISTELPPAE